MADGRRVSASWWGACSATCADVRRRRVEGTGVGNIGRGLQKAGGSRSARCNKKEEKRELTRAISRKSPRTSFVRAVSRVPADSNPGIPCGSAASSADLVLHFRLEEMNRPKPSERASKQARGAAIEAGNCVRAREQPTALAERVPAILRLISSPPEPESDRSFARPNPRSAAPLRYVTYLLLFTLELT